MLKSKFKKPVVMILMGTSLCLNLWLLKQNVSSIADFDQCSTSEQALQQGVDDLTNLVLMGTFDRAQILKYLKSHTKTETFERLIEQDKPGELYAFPLRYRFDGRGKLTQIEGLKR